MPNNKDSVLTVLVVEDEPGLKKSYANFLENEGYKVLTASNGEEALTQIKDNPPALILLDLGMPVLDGVAFLEKADVVNNFPSTKVIVFTNSDDEERIDLAFELGATRYLMKAMLAPKELGRIIREELNLK